MYDILQLNDMLVPELLDIAEQLNIENPKKLDKQGLIYKILDRQAVSASGGGAANDKPKRKRIIKATTANTTEEAVVEEPIVVEEKKPVKKLHPKKDDRPKKGRKKTDEDTEQVELPLETEAAISDAQSPSEDGLEQIEPPQPAEKNLQVGGAAKYYPQRREQAFNIEFDGVINAEGVLEMMPDGYGFLR